MPKRVAEGGEGSEDGNGVYSFIRDLIVEGKDAKLVNQKGRFVINWSRALDRYADYKSKKNSQFKSKKFNRRKASNGLRSALLNFYKKEGAKEYKESKQVNEKDEVVERQFQMPLRVFASLFGGVQQTEKSEEDRQETSSSVSEGEMDAQVSPSSSASDTGFDELMDMPFYGVDFEGPVAGSFNVPGDIPSGPCLNVIKTEEGCEGGDVFLTDTSFPSQMFDDASALDSALEEICSDGPSDETSEDMDLLGVVQDICPTSGSVKGGYQFNITLTEQLPDDVTSGIAQFEGVANVKVHRLNPFTLSGTVPASHQPGDVPVTVVTQTGQRLGMTCFRYVDEMREMVRQLVKDPTLQSLWFAIWSQEHGFFGNDSNIAQVLGPLDMQDQDSSSQTKQQQSLKVLQLLVYTAAQTNAQQFIEMIFSTSAGQVVFNSYKDGTPLPEDVARANGHEDLAQYLQDVNIRLSKQVTSDVQANVIDWLELVKAVQNQASVAQDESSKPLKQSGDNEDNSSDYFADAETSSCGSFDLDGVYDSDSVNAESIDKEPCTSDGISKPEPNKRPFICEEGSSDKIPIEKIEPADSKEDKGVSRWGLTYRLSEWFGKWRKRYDNSSMPQAAPVDKNVTTESSTTKCFLIKESLFGRDDASCEATAQKASKTRTTKPKEHGQHNRARSTGKTDAGVQYQGILVACVLITVLVGFKLGEGQILHWAVGNGYTRISKLLLHCGVYVDAPGFLKETPLHLASKNGFRDLVDILVQGGGNVNARNFPRQETPLHLAALNGHQYIAGFLIQHGSKVNVQNAPLQDTPLHLASRNGHKQVADILLQHGSDVSARNVPFKNTPLHLAAQNGHQQVADILLQRGSNVNARNSPWQETPLHLAARNGHQHIAEFLIQHGGKVNSRNAPWQATPLHFAAQNGHKQVADILVEQGSDVNARNFPRQETPLHLATQNGHQHIAEFLKQQRGKVNSQHVPWQETPLHLAAQKAHQHTAEVSKQLGRHDNTRNVSRQEICSHLAVQNEHKQVAETVLQCVRDVSSRGSMGQNTLLHGESTQRMVSKNGHTKVADDLTQHGSNISSRHELDQAPAHLSVQNGHKHKAEVLTGNESHLNKLFPLHPVTQCSRHQEMSEFSLQHQTDVNTRSITLHAMGSQLKVMKQHKHVSQVLAQSHREENVINSTVCQLTEESSHQHAIEVSAADYNMFQGTPTKNWQARRKHFKASIEHLVARTLKGIKEEILQINPSDINCKAGLGFSKRKRWFSQESTRCTRKSDQKSFCQAFAPWHFMQCRNIKRKSQASFLCSDHGSLNKRSLGSGVCDSFFQTIGENWSFYELISGHTGLSTKSNKNELLMGSVLPQDVQPNELCQPYFTTAFELVVVIDALLALCFFVTLYLWCKHQYPSRNKTACHNGHKPQKNKQNIHELAMECGLKECQQPDELGIELCMIQEENQTLCLGDLPMNRACPKELRMERLRFWFTSNLEEELSCVHSEDSLDEPSVREVPELEVNDSETLCTVFFEIPTHPASPVNNILAIGDSLMQPVSLNSGCLINFPLQPDTKWVEGQMRCLGKHLEISNEDLGQSHFHFDSTCQLQTVVSESGAIITVCSSMAIQDNPLLETGCFQYGRVANSSGWVSYPDPPSECRFCGDVVCVGLKNKLSSLLTATIKQTSISSISRLWMPQAMQRRARVPLEEEELLLIGHKLKNIGDNLETCEKNGRQRSKKLTAKENKNTIGISHRSITKRCCGIRAEDT